MCRTQNTVHLFSILHLMISKRFEEIKDGEEQCPLKSMTLPFKLQSDLCPCLTSREIEKYSYQGFCHPKKTKQKNLTVSEAHR